MLDLFGIVVSSVAIWVALFSAVQLNRTVPWFQKIDRSVRRAAAPDDDVPVWRRRN